MKRREKPVAGKYSTQVMKYERGWSEFLIGHLLGPPDYKLADDDYAGYDVWYYDQERVRAAEDTEEFAMLRRKPMPAEVLRKRREANDKELQAIRHVRAELRAQLEQVRLIDAGGTEEAQCERDADRHNARR